MPGLILHEPQKKFVLSSGKVDDTYIDVKAAYGEPEITRQIAWIFGNEMDEDVNCVVASGHGGLPIAIVLADWENIRLGMIRTEPKRHGKGGMVDSHIPNKKDVVLIVDDVLTTGGSVKKIRKEVTKRGARIAGTYVVVKRGNPRINFDVSYILTADDLESAPSQTF